MAETIAIDVPAPQWASFREENGERIFTARLVTIDDDGMIRAAEEKDMTIYLEVQTWPMSGGDGNTVLIQYTDPKAD